MKINIENLNLIHKAMNDHWGFGLLMDCGTKIAISHINSLSEDEKGNFWMEAELLDDKLDGYLSSPTLRTTCNINCSKISVIYQLWDS